MQWSSLRFFFDKIVYLATSAIEDTTREQLRSPSMQFTKVLLINWQLIQGFTLLSNSMLTKQTRIKVSTKRHCHSNCTRWRHKMGRKKVWLNYIGSWFVEKLARELIRKKCCRKMKEVNCLGSQVTLPGSRPLVAVLRYEWARDMHGLTGWSSGYQSNNKWCQM